MKKQRFTSQDFYVKASLIQKYIVVVTLGFVMSLTLTLFRPDTLKNRLIMLAVFLGLIMASVLVMSIKKIEIHGDTILYRNYFFYKKYYDITQVSLIELKKEGGRKAIFYGVGKKKLFTVNVLMEECTWALWYLGSRNVKVGPWLSIGSMENEEGSRTYQEAYDEFCEEVVKVETGSRSHLAMAQVISMGPKRIKYLTSLKSGEQKQRKERAKKALSFWNLKEQELKKEAPLNTWKLKEKRILSGSEDVEASLRRSNAREYLRASGIQMEQVVPTKDGKPYIIQDGVFFEMKSKEKGNFLGAFHKKHKRYKKEFYQAGEAMARLYLSLCEQSDLLVIEEQLEEAMVEPASVMTCNRLAQVEYKRIPVEEWTRVIREWEEAAKILPKNKHTALSIISFEERKGKVTLTDHFFGIRSGDEVELYNLCSYMAGLAAYSALQEHKVSHRKWKRLLHALCNGYESVRPFEEEEKDSLKLMVQAAILGKIAEELPQDRKNKKLVKLYRYVSKKL